MASEMIHIEIHAPETPSVEITGAEVIVPGSDGIFTVRPGHTPVLSTLAPGVLIVVGAKDAQTLFAVSGGFAEVKNDSVVILADAFEEGNKIDIGRAKASQERAQLRLAKPEDDTDLARAEMALARSLARLQAQQRQGL